MTKSEMALAVKRNIGNRTDKDVVIGEALNFALSELSQLHDFFIQDTRSTATTVIDSEYVDLGDSSIVKTVFEARVMGASPSVIQLRPKTWIVDKYPDVGEVTSGVPAYAYQEGNYLYIAPVADAVYTIGFSYYPDIIGFALDSSENPIPLLQQAIIEWATGYVFDSIELFERGVAWKTRAYTSAKIAVDRDRRSFRTRQFTDYPGTAYEPDNVWASPGIYPFAQVTQR